MKKIFIIFIIIHISFYVYSQIKINKGDIAQFDGILITEEKMEKIVKDLKKYQILVNEKTPNLDYLNTVYEMYILEIEKERDLWKLKYETERLISQEYLNNNNRLKIYNRILLISNNISWSFVVGASVGIAVKISLDYNKFK